MLEQGQILLGHQVLNMTVLMKSRLMMTKNTRQVGMTLVELLIAMMLTGILGTAIVNMVGRNVAQAALSNSYGRIQESGRLALDLISEDLRMAGFRGCINPRTGSTILTSLIAGAADDASDYDAFLYRYNEQKVDVIDDYEVGAQYNTAAGGNRMPMSGSFPNNTVPVEGTDVLIIRGAVASNIQLAQSYTSLPGAGLVLNGNATHLSEIQDGRTMILSTCISELAVIFAASGMDQTTEGDSVRTVPIDALDMPGLPQNMPGVTTLGDDYPAGAELNLLNTSVYFVALSNAINEDFDGDGVNDVQSLYKFSELNGLQELIPYVEDFQLQFGVASSTSLTSVSEYLDGSDPLVADAATGSLSDPDSILSVSFEVSVITHNQGPNNLQPLVRNYSRVSQLRNSAIGVAN